MAIPPGHSASWFVVYTPTRLQTLVYVPGGLLARIIHESLCYDRHLHAIPGRTRASQLDIPAGMPASLIAARGPI
jgi:hypothetical protein